MDHYQLISSNFQSTIEMIAMSVDDLAGPVEQASESMVEALLQDRKIISCGNGVDGALGQLFACNLLSRFENDRPALPALALNGDGASLTAIAQTGGLTDIYARQVRALGQAGDTLLCINSNEESNNLLRVVQAAHEREMRVVALTSAADSELGSLLQQDDVEICIGSERRPRIVELHTMVIHSLCELIEVNLFGSYIES
jgi:phosphoheptose isomerase